MKKLLTLTLIVLATLSCKKDYSTDGDSNKLLDLKSATYDKNSNKLLDLKDVIYDKNFHEIITNDSIIYKSMLIINSTNYAIGKKVNSEDIKSEEDCRNYFSKKGYNTEQIFNLLNRNLILYQQIKQNYGLDNNAIVTKFNEIYSASFSIAISAKKYSRNQGKLSVVDPGNGDPNDEIGTACLNAFIATWNTNVANYRKNAEACIALPGPLGTACVALAYLALVRQQEAAWNTYHDCRFPPKEVN